MDDPEPNLAEQDEPSPAKPSLCACIQDPFAALPPELRPKAQPRMGGLRKVTCPGCGIAYWTNRATDLCVECEKKGLKAPAANTQEG